MSPYVHEYWRLLVGGGLILYRIRYRCKPAGWLVVGSGGWHTIASQPSIVRRINGYQRCVSEFVLRVVDTSKFKAQD